MLLTENIYLIYLLFGKLGGSLSATERVSITYALFYYHLLRNLFKTFSPFSLIDVNDNAPILSPAGTGCYASTLESLTLVLK